MNHTNTLGFLPCFGSIITILIKHSHMAHSHTYKTRLKLQITLSNKLRIILGLWMYVHTIEAPYLSVQHLIKRFKGFHHILKEFSFLTFLPVVPPNSFIKCWIIHYWNQITATWLSNTLEIIFLYWFWRNILLIVLCRLKMPLSETKAKTDDPKVCNLKKSSTCTKPEPSWVTHYSFFFLLQMRS